MTVARTARSWKTWVVTLAALLAAAPQCIQYFRYVQRGDYPGSVYAPRIDAVLNASTSTLQGGPFATVPAKGGFSVAAGLINDLGTATLVSTWTKITGAQATRATLGWLNLWFLVGACVLLVFAFPVAHRLWLIPIFLGAPMMIPLYSNVDSVAIHGALAALAISAVLLPLRTQNVALALAGGVLLFVIHKVRLVYALYGFMALLAAMFLIWAVFRSRGVLRTGALVLLGFVVCEVPWRVAVSTRLNDPRLVERDALPAHNTYEALISGIGWTPNPWGLKPEDPWIAQFLADTFHGPVVKVESRESERRAKEFYVSLVKRNPMALTKLYLGRVPEALTTYSILGAAGAVAWVSMGLGALFLAFRRRDQQGLIAVIVPMMLALGLLLQIIVIDTRPIYAYPLGLVSAIVLAISLAVIVRNARGTPSIESPAN